MRTQIMGFALLGALATSAGAQTEPTPVSPLPKGQTPELVPPVPRAPWGEQQQQYGTLEASSMTMPTTGLPIEGVGLPPGTPPQARKPEAVPCLRIGAGEIFQASGTNDPPYLEDFSGPAPSQPLMQGFESIGPNGLTPPDPDAAAGWDYVMTVTNDDFATYDRCGNELFRSDIHDFLGVDTSYLLYDPKIMFDPWNARWVMMYHKKKNSTEESSFALIISQTSEPFGLGGWYWYDFNAQQTSGGNAAFADYFDMGFSNNFVTLGGNMFFFNGGFLWGRIWVLDKAQIYNALGAGSVRWSNLSNPDGSGIYAPRTPKMQVGWSEGGMNIDGTWINSRAGGGNKITHWKVQDAFAGNTLTGVDIDTNDYTLPPNAVQPNGAQLDTIDCRLMPAVTTHDYYGSETFDLFTGLSAERSGVSGVFLLKINPASNTLEFQSLFGAGGLDYWFPSPAADYSGSGFWVFSRTGAAAGNEPEIRFVDFNQGTFSSSSAQIRDGDGNYGGFRWGDYFGGQLDWGDWSANYSVSGQPAKVWLFAEFGKSSSWGTYVGATSTWNQGNLSSVSPSSTYSISGLVGGTFSPSSRSYSLSNSGEVGLAYEVLSLPSWLDASPPTGQVFPTSGASVDLVVNAVASSLPPGFYSDDVLIRDSFNGGNSYWRHVELTVIGTPGVPYCPGDGVSPHTNCPCGNNNNGSYGGCYWGNGSYPTGGRLFGTGIASWSANNAYLHTVAVSNNFGIFFGASNRVNGGNGSTLNDGLRCAGGGLVRLTLPTMASGNSASTPQPVPMLDVGGAPGITRRYQYWFRTPGGPCSQDANLTNGYEIIWTP